MWYVASTHREGYASINCRVRNGSTTVSRSWHIRDTCDFEIPSSPRALTSSSTLAQLEETSWSVELRDIDGERFVVLPAGSLEHPPWTVGGRPAVKLSSE